MDLVSTLIEAEALRSKERHEEARQLLSQLALEFPTNPVVQYKTACVYDLLGREREAIPYYRAAIENELPDPDLRSAYLGLGSTYRTLGQYTESKKVFLEGMEHFPDANEMMVFLAMTLYNLGQHHEAVSTLLKIIARASSDERIKNYERAILFYAEDLDQKWD